MELEMKYSIPSREIAEAVRDDDYILSAAGSSGRKRTVMKAVYFDTEDRLLSENNIAFRVRSENGIMIATLKWDGKSENGFHSRQEINVPVNGENCFLATPADIFNESEDGRELLKLIGDRPLVNLLEMRFLRSCERISCGESIIELAIDMGSIVTDSGELPIMELELELYAGDPEDIKILGGKLARKYGLAPENKSKLQRGLELIGGSAKQ